MSTITRNNMHKALLPGVRNFFGLAYKAVDPVSKRIFEQLTSSQHYEEDVKRYGLGPAGRVEEGAGFQYDTMGEDWSYRYLHQKRVIGFKITDEAFADNLQYSASRDASKSAGQALAYARQVEGAKAFNFGFTNAFMTGDKRPLFGIHYHSVGGGYNRNTLLINSDLNETSLKAAIDMMEDWRNDRGMKLVVKAKQLIIPQNLAWNAEVLMRSVGRVGTADNDINPIKSLNVIPGVVVHPWIDNPDSWFIQTDIQDGAKEYTRDKVKSSSEADFDNGVTKFKFQERYSFGVSDPMAFFGNEGI